MATYVYETINQREGEAPRRFELVQSMKDAPLVQHPDTGGNQSNG
jgi:predicted nucleic acid-binding Zn ribbon protein